MHEHFLLIQLPDTQKQSMELLGKHYTQISDRLTQIALRKHFYVTQLPETQKQSLEVPARSQITPTIRSHNYATHKASARDDQFATLPNRSQQSLRSLRSLRFHKNAQRSHTQHYDWFDDQSPRSDSHCSTFEKSDSHCLILKNVMCTLAHRLQQDVTSRSATPLGVSM